MVLFALFQITLLLIRLPLMVCVSIFYKISLRFIILILHGNVRKNPKLSGTTHNVFGIQVGVGITIAIRYFTAYETEIVSTIVCLSSGVRQRN